jgi:hypothetical protein
MQPGEALLVLLKRAGGVVAEMNYLSTWRVAIVIRLDRRLCSLT